MCMIILNMEGISLYLNSRLTRSSLLANKGAPNSATTHHIQD